ncbi:putative ABC-type transporter, ATPase protein [Desulforapulum autotrophicum HRM2]|uniref:ABC-type transporter, ATPase protein n=1 Tax=Desulforapulum autotrophicum (strain ATCC 43914 / DSM 3382 / VKM B-1955 / HRM2) TaxID=177437 RepID=C0QK55_DESAH|nr:ABC transporter ATP-binding protein [Desulforapulum autotrophicum]ACN16081.1 putative ABC-type transporter, ATPase protein [Desulforapulum autotrophicum HRM2]
MSSNIVIKCSGLNKCYNIYKKPLDRLKQAFFRGRRRFFKEFWALKNVSLEISQGETVGIIGANGSGKSTLLQMFCGILSAGEGELEVKGRVSALLELGAGFNPEFTGAENVRLNASIMGLSAGEIEERFEPILEFANIGEFIHRPVKTYSSGMYVRLAFAVAVNVSPDILIIDEALSVGDIRFQQKCMAKIKQFCRTGTVIFVSHDMGAVTELCTRVIWLDGGRVREDGPPKAVAEKYLEFMYEGDRKPAVPLPEKIEMSMDSTLKKGFVNFDESIRQFGNRRAKILSARFSTDQGGIGTACSGSACKIEIIVQAFEAVCCPIIGYIVNDRLGRGIFGDNTSLIQKKISPLENGKRYCICFHLHTWPNLVCGDYTVSLALADGTMDDHSQCHYLHDALVVNSISTRPAVGLFSPLQTKVDFHLIG